MASRRVGGADAPLSFLKTPQAKSGVFFWCSCLQCYDIAMQNELRRAAQTKIQELIDGTITPAQAREWADAAWQPAGNRILIEASESLEDLYTSLQICDEAHSGNELMYDKTSYIEWLQQYKELVEQEEAARLSSKLTESEAVAQGVITCVTSPFAEKLTLKASHDEYGATWQISPQNTKAAGIYVFGVDDATVNVSVDDIYSFEIFTNNQGEGMAEFADQLLAIMLGNITGWHDPTTMGNTREKTLLEVQGGPKWCGNVFFPSRFKKRKGVVMKAYKGY